MMPTNKPLPDPVVIDKDLEVKLKLCTSFIVKEVIALDPLARREWLFTYKGVIQYADSHGNELTQEQILGADIYRDLIKQVEELIKEEDFEGQNYNAYKSRDPDYETIYKKRLIQNKQILKMYSTVGRDVFKGMLPNGIEEALKNTSESQ